MQDLYKIVDELTSPTERELQSLEREAIEIAKQLTAAALRRDPAEIARLKGRQSELPGEIIKAEIEICNLEISELKSAVKAAEIDLEAATRQTAELVPQLTAKVRELEAEKVRLQNDAALAIENSRSSRHVLIERQNDLGRAERELTKLWLKLAA